MIRLLFSQSPVGRVVAPASLLAMLIFGNGLWAATKKPPLRPININSATSDELQLVPGIGPATADKILQMRKSYGAFKSVDDLLAIRGIGKKRLDKMRKYLTAGKPAAPSRSSRPANCDGCEKATPFAKEVTLPVKPKAPAKHAAEEPPAPPAATEPESEPEEPRL
jgi:competence ComEA-like helix-hairpin-helix protein